MKESVFGLMLKMLISIISWLMRLLRPTGADRRLYGYVFTITNTFTNSIYIGTSISQNKIEEIKQTYYRSKKFKLQIVYRTHSTTHKQRQKVLSELQDYYYNIYSKNHIVLQI